VSVTERPFGVAAKLRGEPGVAEGVDEMTVVAPLPMSLNA